MRPLPAQLTASVPASTGTIPSLPAAIAVSPGVYSTANRRASTCGVQRVYPWLLFTSTMIAGLFCLMYITKPVIIVTPGSNSTPASATVAIAKAELPIPSAPTPANSGLMPSADRLPGEKSIAPATARQASGTTRSSSQSGSPFEETNLRIQHVLTAESPGGQVARIDIDVPVLYQSRNLRWTPAEIAQARNLLIHLSDYQEKSKILRAEGIELLDSWNNLVERSIPTADLRADSPTLPVNQQDAADAPRAAGLDTTESIQIQPSK